MESNNDTSITSNISPSRSGKAISPKNPNGVSQGVSNGERDVHDTNIEAKQPTKQNRRMIKSSHDAKDAVPPYSYSNGTTSGCWCRLKFTFVQWVIIMFLLYAITSSSILSWTTFHGVIRGVFSMLDNTQTISQLNMNLIAVNFGTEDPYNKPQQETTGNSTLESTSESMAEITTKAPSRWGTVTQTPPVPDESEQLIADDPELIVTPGGIFDLSVARKRYNKDDNLDEGILSTKDSSFFRMLQEEIDNFDNVQRCKRYRASYNSKNPTRRRLFFGALTASEPWELFEIVSTEVYGMYDGIVFVEGNRTQNLTPRKLLRLHHTETLKLLFGTDNLQVRLHVNEKGINGLAREHAQRHEILKGWKELGMTEDDVGIIADSDETFTRDFLHAARVCDGIVMFDYKRHYCHHSKVKLIGSTRVYESTPECITKDRMWFHPDMILGKCIDGIASPDSIHKSAPRTPRSFLRAKGWGKDIDDWDSYKTVKNNSYPLWNAADFRRTSGGQFMSLASPIQFRERNKEVDPNTKKYDRHTAFHLHNFFYNFTAARFKYKTYGHPDRNVDSKRIHEISNDLKMMYNCIMNLPDEDSQKWKRIQGGYNYSFPFYPIYFHDEDYRQRRTMHVHKIVVADDKFILQQRELKSEQK